MNEHAFEFVVGVNPGYFHDNPCSTPLIVVSDAWNKAAEQCLADGGSYIPVVMHEAKAVYRREWGCPIGGETVVVVSGVRNPEFNPVPVQWSACVTLICETVRTLLGQTTATLRITPCHFAYLKDEPKEQQ